MSESKNIIKFMSLESLQLFSAGLAHLNASEVAKAKELFIRNAITEYQSARKSRKNNYLTMGLHFLIPIFWPMLFGSQKKAKIELEEQKKKIENALEVWKDDLGSKYKDLKSLLDQ